MLCIIINNNVQNLKNATTFYKDSELKFFNKNENLIILSIMVKIYMIEICEHIVFISK